VEDVRIIQRPWQKTGAEHRSRGNLTIRGVEGEVAVEAASEDEVDVEIMGYPEVKMRAVEENHRQTRPSLDHRKRSRLL